MGSTKFDFKSEELEEIPEEADVERDLKMWVAGNKRGKAFLREEYRNATLAIALISAQPKTNNRRLF